MATIIPAKLLRAGAMTGFVTTVGLGRADFVVATDELLAAAMPGEGDADKATREVGVGDFIAVYLEGDETKRVHVPFADLFGDKAEVAGQFVIDKPGSDENMYFLGRHMLKAREALFVLTAGEGEVNPEHRRLLGALQASFERILAEPDQFPAEAVKQAMIASTIDAYGNAELPVEPEAFLRKVRAETLRMGIAAYAPTHPDALGADPVGVDEVLLAAGLGGGALRGAKVRGPAGQQLREADMVRMVKANDRLCREVFGAVTTTDIANLSVRMLTPGEHQTLVQHFEQNDTLMSGEWIDQVRQRIGAITGGAMPGYTFEAVIGSEGGRDVLLVTDSVSSEMATGVGRGVAYLYSWPTAERQPLMEVNRGFIATFGPEDVPSEEEVERLQAIYNEFTLAADNDMDFDIGEDEDEDDFDVGALPRPRMIH